MRDWWLSEGLSVEAVFELPELPKCFGVVEMNCSDPLSRLLDYVVEAVLLFDWFRFAKMDHEEAAPAFQFAIACF